MQYMQPFMDYMSSHPEVGILFAFLVAFIESLPLLGTLFPGSITMTAIGALIGSSVLPAAPTILAALLGAYIGDCLGFWMGSHFHEEIRLLWPFSKLSKYFDIGEKFFAKHGGKSIIIGRFIGPTRAAMPLLAGILHYRWRQFLPVTAVAAVLWTLVYIAPGIFLGALAAEFSPEETTKVILFGLVVIVFFWLIFWIMQLFFKRLSQMINHRIQKWWMALSRPQSGAGWLVRLIRNQHHPLDFHQLKLALLILISGGLFLLLWFNVVEQGVMTKLNQPLFYLFQSFRSPRTDHVWAALTVLGNPESLLVTSLLIAFGLLICKQYRAGIHCAVLGVISAAAAEVVKRIYFSPRPEGFVEVVHSSSFPSGHVTLSVAVLGFLAYLTTRIFPRGWRQLIYLLFIVFIGLISLSRLFLGQHWFTDVLGAWLLGLSLLWLMVLSYRRQPPVHAALQSRKKQWLAMIFIGACVPWLITGLFTFQSLWLATQPVWPTLSLNFQHWWQTAQPFYRRDRLGREAQPFNVQWAGQLADIQTFLLNRGWQPLEQQSTMHSTLQRFFSLQPEHNMPLLPWLYQNKPPVVFFIKHVNNSPDILELRLWESGMSFADSPLPLWLGILTYHTPPEKLLRFPHRYIHLQSGAILLDKSTQSNGFEFEWVRIPTEQQPKRIQSLHWDGAVFLLKPSY